MDKPKQYTRGWVEFFKLKFKVNPNVLIPRPETELLVDAVINLLAHQPVGSSTILDIGTGAGNIAISIAKNLASSHMSSGNVKFIATDISEKALKVARQNAKLHGVEGQTEFIQSDLLKNVDTEIIRPEGNCVIVTNLPYIPSNRIPYLDSSVKDYEPHLALDGGEDGFELYRKLFEQVKEKGWKPKLIIGEIDYTHGELAVKEAQKYFLDAAIEVKTDLTHKQRILTITH